MLEGCCVEACRTLACQRQRQLRGDAWLQRRQRYRGAAQVIRAGAQVVIKHIDLQLRATSRSKWSLKHQLGALPTRRTLSESASRSLTNSTNC
jgi:hypothetical protein